MNKAFALKVLLKLAREPEKLGEASRCAKQGAVERRASMLLAVPWLASSNAF